MLPETPPALDLSDVSDSSNVPPNTTPAAAADLSPLDSTLTVSSKTLTAAAKTSPGREVATAEDINQETSPLASRKEKSQENDDTKNVGCDAAAEVADGAVGGTMSCAMDETASIAVGGTMSGTASGVLGGTPNGALGGTVRLKVHEQVDEEHNYVKRLINLGFDRSLVKEALLATCYDLDRTLDYLYDRKTHREGMESVVDTGGKSMSGIHEAMHKMTHDDVKALKRLTSMGFIEHYALQVFINCGKNEKLATKFLLDEKNKNQPSKGSVVGSLVQNQTEGAVAGEDVKVELGVMNGRSVVNLNVEANMDANRKEQLTNPEQVSGNEVIFNLEDRWAEMTESDLILISRMASLGFDESEVLHAYLVCDKKENLALNYLLDHCKD